MNLAILTSPNQWFSNFAVNLSVELGGAHIFENHNDISDSYDVVFILSYHKIIENSFLSRNKHNIVIQASDLPAGKGWAPLFWQVLKGKSKVTFSMFEATEDVDDGPIYMQQELRLNGLELNNELRIKQAEIQIKMCKEFVENYSIYSDARHQIGVESFYPKRNASDSELDINKTIKEQFNMLRIVDNNEYPAFFYIDGKKFVLKVYSENS
jgi:methionyl-tRNA formyltransferase